MMQNAFRKPSDWNDHGLPRLGIGFDQAGKFAVMFTACLLGLTIAGCGSEADQQFAPEPFEPIAPTAEKTIEAESTDVSPRIATTAPTPPITAREPLSVESLAPAERLAPAESLVEKAIELLEIGESESALKVAFQARELAPDDPNVLFTVARGLAARRRFHEAVRTLDRLAAAHPETWLPAIGQTAEWLVEMGETEEAEKRYRALRREVDDASQSFIDRQLALMFLRQGRRLDAAKIFQTLCASGDINLPELMMLLRISIPLSDQMNLPENVDPITPLGRAQAAVGRGEWDKALRDLDRSEQTDEVVAMRGRVYAQQQQQEKLKQWALREYPNTPANPEASFAWGVYQLQIEDANQAAKALASVIIADPTDQDAYQWLAKSLVALNRSNDAERIAARAELIGQTQTIGKKLAGGSVTADEMRKLAGLLEQLQRPLEALAWRAMRVSFEQSGGQIDAAQAA
ncbi:MAG: hypothetical protein GY904_16180, partial [Planctomycetaceae bacterium]|nr:hypothetical protein [Planctomycetaceae bacterium]